MPVSVLPALLDGLVQMATSALTNITVYDGFGVSDDPGDYLMIGVDDPNQLNMASSATSDQTMATMGRARSRDEVGEVTCCAVSWNGDADQKAARDAAFATAAAMENGLRTDPSVGGVPNLLWAQYGTRLAFSQGQDDEGASAMLIFSIQFKARI